MVYSTAIGFFRSVKGAGKVLEMDEQKVLELYAKYDNCRQVAEELGTSGYVVRKVLIEHGVSRTGNRPKREPKYRMPSNCNKKHCNAMVVMLCENLDVNTSDISVMTGVPIASVTEIVKRKCPESFKSQKPRLDISIIDAIERDYLAGDSTYAISEKYNVNRTTLIGLMGKRGHSRGKGRGPAADRMNHARTDEANRNLIEEFGDKELAGKKGRQTRRAIRTANRRHDYGITWKAIARRNNSFKCEVCGIECNPNDKTWGSSGPTHPSVDHIVRICDGGEDVWGNVRLACMKCNLELNAKANRKARLGHGDDGGRYERRHAPGTAESTCARDSGQHRHGRRVAQHGAARAAVPRDDTRDCRVGGRRR